MGHAARLIVHPTREFLKHSDPKDVLVLQQPSKLRTLCRTSGQWLPLPMTLHGISTHSINSLPSFRDPTWPLTTAIVSSSQQVWPRRSFASIAVTLPNPADKTCAIFPPKHTYQQYALWKGKPKTRATLLPHHNSGQKVRWPVILPMVWQVQEDVNLL